jgi:hypothetical protein
MSLNAALAMGATFDDDFAAGLRDDYWSRIGNQPLYVVDDSQGDVRFSKPYGGSYSFQYVGIEFTRDVVGDFDVQVDFRQASITCSDGSPGNQVQLNVIFAPDNFDVVRSDEIGYGHNCHIWRSPDGGWHGEQATTSTNGTMRVVRVGGTASGYYNGDLLWSDAFPTNPVRVSLVLQNNGTKDATSVTFDNFCVTAASFVPTPAVISSISATTATVALVIGNLTEGASNAVQRADSLSESAIWTNAYQFRSEWGTTNWAEPISPGRTQAFYRVRTQ